MSGFGLDIQKYASVNESICQIFIAKFIWYMYYLFVKQNLSLWMKNLQKNKYITKWVAMEVSTEKLAKIKSFSFWTKYI